MARVGSPEALAKGLVPIQKSEDEALYKARAYRNPDTGEIVSRRQADNLTPKQTAARKYREAGFEGNLAPSRKEAHFIRFGPYPTLSEALYDPRLTAKARVVIGAYGTFLASATSGTAGQDGWLALFSLYELGPLRNDDAKMALIFKRRQENFAHVRGFYVWVQR
jgi:hypothetical protein